MTAPVPAAAPASPPAPAPLEWREPHFLRTLFHSTFCNLLLVVDTFFFGLLATFFGFVPPRGRWMLLACRLWSHVLLWGSGVKVRHHFEEPLDPKQGYVFLANHQSMYDIPALLVSVPSEVRFLAKKSLFYIPFFGWGLWAGGFIPVDRKDRKAAVKTYKLAEEALRSGHSLMIFPEETRSEDGRLLPFKRGGMVLAQRTGFPIVPVGIEGTCRVKPKGSYHVKPGVVMVRYGRPLLPTGPSAEDQAALGQRARLEISRLANAPIQESP